MTTLYIHTFFTFYKHTVTCFATRVSMVIPRPPRGMYMSLVVRKYVPPSKGRCVTIFQLESQADHCDQLTKDILVDAHEWELRLLKDKCNLGCNELCVELPVPIHYAMKLCMINSNLNFHCNIFFCFMIFIFIHFSLCTGVFPLFTYLFIDLLFLPLKLLCSSCNFWQFCNINFIGKWLPKLFKNKH